MVDWSVGEMVGQWVDLLVWMEAWNLVVWLAGQKVVLKV